MVRMKFVKAVLIAVSIALIAVGCSHGSRKHKKESFKITTTALPEGEVGVAYPTTTLTATGGTAPYSWSDVNNTLQTYGLTLDSATGEITGTPTQATPAGGVTVTIEVADSSVPAAKRVQKDFTLIIYPELRITTTSLPGGYDGQTGYAATLTATGGTGNYTWTLVSGNLPPNLQFDFSGLVSGDIASNASQNSPYSFTVAVTDGMATVQGSVTMEVYTQLQVTTTSLPDAYNAQVGYSAQLNATGGTGTYTWSLVSGSLPPNLQLNSSGLISGDVAINASQNNPYNFTVEVSDGIQTAQANLSIIVLSSQPLQVLTTSLPDGYDGQRNYSAPLQATGGSGIYTWSLVSGSLPPNLSLSSSGVISGNITDNASINSPYNFTVEVSDGTQTAQADLSITVLSPYCWAKRIGGAGVDRIDYSAIAVDTTGNLYIVGSFGGTVNFGEDWGVTDTKTLTGTADIFITKIDVNGNYYWTKRIGGSGGSGCSAYGMALAVDSNGNVYITGNFDNTVDFGADWGVSDQKTPLGYCDAFITKIDANGNYCWTKQIGGSGFDSGLSVTTDSSGNVYVTGFFGSTVNFAADWGGSDAKTASGMWDAFITKIDANGNYCWTKRIGGSGFDQGESIITDSQDNVYLVGDFNSTTNFGADWGTSDSKTPAGYYDAFIMKVDASGNYCWTKRIGGSDFDYGFSVAADTSGNIYVSGYFKGTVNFAADWSSNDTKTSYTVSTPHGPKPTTDIFVTKIDSNGDYCWTKRIGGPGDEGGGSGSSGFDPWCAVLVDPNGNLFITGCFEDTVDFGEDWGVSDPKTAAGSHDAFITRVDANGDYVWTKHISGTGWGRAMAFKGGALFLAGFFYDTIDFSSAWNTSDTKTSAGYNDVFILKVVIR